MAKTYLTFSECDFTFGDNGYIFSDVSILEQASLILNGAASDDDYHRDLEEKLTPSELEALIRVVCKINGVSYKEVKTIKKGKITINTSEIKVAINKYKKTGISIK